MNKMMMNGSNNKNEEFSFPVISNNPLSNLMLSSSSSSSSSLWRISSRVYHQPEDYDYEDHKVEENNAHPMEVRSMCEEILPSNYITRDQEIDELVKFNGKQLEVEQSMDYLWEDFNEEENITDYINERKSIDGEMSVLKVNKITSTKPNNSSRNKLVVIGKLLKGLISIRKSAQLKLFKVESKVFMRQA